MKRKVSDTQMCKSYVKLCFIKFTQQCGVLGVFVKLIRWQVMIFTSGGEAFD